MKIYSKKKIAWVIIAFCLGLILSIVITLVSAPLFIPFVVIVNILVAILQKILFMSGSTAAGFFLNYSILILGFIFCPLVNALLLRFSDKPNKLQFIVLLIQMLLFWVYVDSLHWYTPLCVGNDCLLPRKQMATLNSSEQFYLVEGGRILAITQILFGCWLGVRNPLATLSQKIRSKKIEIFSGAFSKKKQLWYSFAPYLVGPAVATIIVLIGLVFLPNSNASWLLPKSGARNLTVYIQDNPTDLSLYKPVYREYTLNALSQWQQASKGRFKFILTESDKRCDICITWVSFNTSNWYDLVHLGLTQIDPYHDRLDRIQQALVTIKSQNVPDNAIKKVLLHEIGHALGLMHSNKKNDIMYGNLIPNKEEKIHLLGKGAYNSCLSLGDVKALDERYPFTNYFDKNFTN